MHSAAAEYWRKSRLLGSPGVIVDGQEALSAGHSLNPLGSQGVSLKIPLVGGLHQDLSRHFRIRQEHDRRETGYVQIGKIAPAGEGPIQDLKRIAEIGDGGGTETHGRQTLDLDVPRKRVHP